MSEYLPLHSLFFPEALTVLLILTLFALNFYWFLFCHFFLTAVILLLLLFYCVNGIFKTMYLPDYIIGLPLFFFLIRSWSWHISEVVFRSISICASSVAAVAIF